MYPSFKIQVNSNLIETYIFLFEQTCFLFFFFFFYFLDSFSILFDLYNVRVPYVKLVWSRSRQRESVNVPSRLPVRTLCAHLIYVESTNFRQRKKRNHSTPRNVEKRENELSTNPVRHTYGHLTWARHVILIIFTS